MPRNRNWGRGNGPVAVGAETETLAVAADHGTDQEEFSAGFWPRESISQPAEVQPSISAFGSQEQ